jgi:hypothetical protein
MSKKMEKKVDELSALAEEELERQAMAIFERYGWNSETLAREASKHEWMVLWKYSEPKIKELFKDFYNICFPLAMQVVFEHKIYPLILSGDKEEENKLLVSGMDLLYIEFVYPDLWKHFMTEIKNSPKYDVDPEGAKNWRLSPELVVEFKEAHEELDKFKDELRAKIAKEDVEDAELCAEELAEEEAGHA